MILAGDIGGTHSRLAYFTREAESIVCKLQVTYSSKEYKTFEDIISHFIQEYKVVINFAALGIAGVVIDGTVRATNLPWIISSKNLSSILHLAQIHLINDLEANTWGIFTLKKKDYLKLNDAAENQWGNIAIISAGTGLGEAGAALLDDHLRPIASEGGHTDFAPRNDLQDSLLKYLRKEFGHVSYERLLSGNGLYNIYRFLRDTKYGEENKWLADQFLHQDKGAVITQNALKDKSPICNETLEIFCQIYGAEAGNVALKFTAKGGVFVGGGIAPKIIDKLKGSKFMEEFQTKGRMSDYLKLIPVKVILNENTALMGACKFALHQAGFNSDIKMFNQNKLISN